MYRIAPAASCEACARPALFFFDNAALCDVVDGFFSFGVGSALVGPFRLYRLPVLYRGRRCLLGLINASCAKSATTLPATAMAIPLITDPLQPQGCRLASRPLSLSLLECTQDLVGLS